MQSLISAAQSLQCDVVLSKPQILDRVISSVQISSPRKLA